MSEAPSQWDYTDEGELVAVKINGEWFQKAHAPYSERIEELERTQISPELLQQIAALPVPFPEVQTGMPFADLSDNDKWQVAVSTTLLVICNLLRATTTPEGERE